jgi:hypothetical protein
MRTVAESSGVVLHDMIERIYFYFIISHKKEMGSEKHTADVVLPAHPAIGLFSNDFKRRYWSRVEIPTGCKSFFHSFLYTN